MTWAWFHKFGSPKWLYDFAERIQKPLLFVAASMMLGGAYWGLFLAPPDYQQGDSFRIIYIHVPAAILAQSVYMMMATAALVGLVWRMKMSDYFIASAAPIGAVMTFLALFTGAVWGKPTWGTWWVWDARLTSMLLLLFLYFGVIALRGAIENDLNRARATYILVLVGVVNIPIIKYSVDWWNTLHQPATFTLTEKPAMPVEMWLPLLVMVIGVYALFACLVLFRLQTEILEREYKTKWVKKLLQERLDV
ncbi:heme ABC transporter permease [Oleiphilus sp. HI0071]|uniref:heme ABC transporter permease n=1 Tax=unclassified Oleiphilus TaxID=2631174 RepID=UPI0007C20D12|nr:MULTISPECIES: heme ABC transporter permease [unclassified Oleiphilus]KZY61247.1 heme ABC transporter permease [Oleiphilus sp. HI0065]KZY81900.1 heme ABC transporter permease [Oleiphilus sp. HI0071]KZY91672.1 heme ABC transporter permease [Oleiphilus sp. HI0073]KZZ39942.1 heme ABC transporter permease [Oleiphilus sp. HI0118]KZZ61865.1 heme ABC transporter permease [Oleiphilus sp. HI0122]KZZ65712.1 heme ABC transporter permease [Oleiphilus sp. HI0130]KZZ78227.1 heme ABC transporter permease